MSADYPTLPPGWTWSDRDPRYPSIRAPNGVEFACASIRQAVRIANTPEHPQAAPPQVHAIAQRPISMWGRLSRWLRRSS